jgi:hypothetical protein
LLRSSRGAERGLKIKGCDSRTSAVALSSFKYRCHVSLPNRFSF